METDTYVLTKRILLALAEKIEAAQSASDTVTYVKQFSNMLELISKIEDRNTLMRENQRLWKLFHDEYMDASGNTTLEWLQSYHGRMQALAAIEGNPRRLKQQGVFET